MMQTIHVAAAVIHNDAGEMLLVRKRGTPFFMQPGGKIAAGETSRDALVRELQEELQWDVAPERLAYLGRFAGRAANEADAIVVAEVFTVPAQAATVMPAAEIEEVLWLGAKVPTSVQFAPLTRDDIIPRFHMGKR